MQKTLLSGMFIAFSTLSVAHGQIADSTAQGPSATSPEPAAAPIVRELPAGLNDGTRRVTSRLIETQPSPGVFVRSDASNGVQTISSAGAATELRVTSGRADVTLHHPADHSEILVDLPGGQVSLLKDGVYTFNAATNTVRVLRGEAEAFNGTKSTAKGAKIKEAQELSFFPNAKLRAVDAYPNELGADLLSNGNEARGHYGRREGGYGDGFYGGGYGYGYPYYAGFYGGPFGFGYPYGYGFGSPFGLGIGLGYYGGFGGYYGGFGGYGGGFRGGFGGRR